MKIEIDTHTHTILSGHAYSTVYENLVFAKRKGLYGVVTAEHGPQMPGAFINFSIEKLNDIPPFIDDVRAYKGAEANIIDLNGTIDLAEKWRGIPDYILVSLHDVVLDSGTAEQNTEALFHALQIPEVDAVAHPGNPYYPIDREALVREAARLNKILEVNNHSFRARSGSLDNCTEIIRLCKRYGVRISVGSDAHNCADVGRLDKAIALLEQEDFPEELVINSTHERFDAYLEERKERIVAAHKLK